MGKEKVVYVLNPDGLTESIFVAKGEPNEGQYRGKRFTKTGWKAEKKRVRDEMLAQAAAEAQQDGKPTNVGSLEPDKGDDWVKSLEEYEKYSETGLIEIVNSKTVTSPNESTAGLPPLDASPVVPEPAGGLTEPVGGVSVEPDGIVETVGDSFEEIPQNVAKPAKPNNVDVELQQVIIYGTVKGIICVTDRQNIPLFFREFPTGFISKTEVLEKLTLTGLKYPTVEYFENDTGEILFKGNAVI